MPASRRIRLSGPAQRDLAGIGAYTLDHWGAVQKRTYLDLIKQALRTVRDMPGLGAARDDIAQGLRCHAVGRHVIFYREIESDLVVVRILHQSMDPTRHMKPERGGEI